MQTIPVGAFQEHAVLVQDLGMFPFTPEDAEGGRATAVGKGVTGGRSPQRTRGPDIQGRSTPAQRLAVQVLNALRGS